MSKVWSHAIDVASNNPLFTGTVQQQSPTNAGTLFTFCGLITAATDNTVFTLLTLTTSSAAANGFASYEIQGAMSDGDGSTMIEVHRTITRVAAAAVTTTSTTDITAVVNCIAHGAGAPTLTLSQTISNGILAIKAKIQSFDGSGGPHMLMIKGQFFAALGSWTVVCT